MFVNKRLETCQEESNQLCDEISKADDTTTKTGFSWGIAASLTADIIISVGLALQKTAHNRMVAQDKAALGAAMSRTSDTGTEQEVDADAPSAYSLPGSTLEKRGSEQTSEEKPASVFKMTIWWVGLFMVIGGEVPALPHPSRRPNYRRHNTHTWL